MQAASGHRLASAIGFSGRPIADGLHGPAPAGRGADITCLILCLFGGANSMIPAEAVAEWDVVLEAGGVSREIVTYEGAPHSLFDRIYDEHSDACNDAWRRTQAFSSVNS